MIDIMISMEDLNVVFGKARTAVHAVKNVSLNIAKGQSFGLVGESGSGKSTILRSIVRLCPIHSGQVKIDGIAVGKRRKKAELKRMQMVFQDPFGSLHPRHIINDVLKDPLHIHKFDNIEDRIVKMLDQVGLGPEFRYRYPHQISGGQRQRVAIARALILEPEILLLDEPTSALDVSVQAEILNLLMELREASDLTYLMVSHNLSVVGHMCNRIAVMNKGKIVEEISDKQLFSGDFQQDYTRQLWVASKGYDIDKIKMFKNYE